MEKMLNGESSAIFETILPDVDVRAFNFGIAFEHLFRHRGFTHSMFFALLWALVLIFVFGNKYGLTWFLVIFLSTSSHGVLDSMAS